MRDPFSHCDVVMYVDITIEPLCGACRGSWISSESLQPERMVFLWGSQDPEGWLFSFKLVLRAPKQLPF